MYLSQGQFGDIKQYRPEEPPITEPLEREVWSYWVKLDGMPKVEAQR